MATESNQTKHRGRPLLATLGVLAAALLLSSRFIAVQPFRLPSGSMQPTLNTGDYILVAKWSYGYSRYSFAPFQDMFPTGRWLAHTPERGDLVVFRPTSEPNRDFVKRIVGMPGDRIRMIGGELHINGQAVQRQSLGEIEVNHEGLTEHIPGFRETLPNGVSYVTLDRTPRSELDNTREFVVPEGHYFMMGDDRDNSADSRVESMVGYVPFDNLIGRIFYVF